MNATIKTTSNINIKDNEIIESLPYKQDEKVPTIREKHLDWIVGIFLKNFKNIQKNLERIDHGHYPVEVQKDFFDVSWFQVIIIHSYNEGKENRPYDIRAKAKLENIELEANKRLASLRQREQKILSDERPRCCFQRQITCQNIILSPHRD